MNDCKACQTALIKPYGGIYHDDCIGCNGRMLGNSMPQVKQSVIEKSSNGDKKAIALVAQAKYWHEVKKNHATNSNMDRHKPNTSR